MEIFNFYMPGSLIFSIMILSLGISCFAFYKYWQFEKRFKGLFSGKNGEDLEDKILMCLDRVNRVDGTNDILLGKIKEIKHDVNLSIKKKALIRYNPFDKEGGDQSFSLCLLDSKNDGVIISSLYNRGSTNIYSKEIVKGESKSVLSDEEKYVLNTAIDYLN